MSMKNIRILATCRQSELLRATTLVFDTVRVGFPTANIKVFLNDPKPEEAEQITRSANNCGCEIIAIPKTLHHVWLEDLIKKESEPWVSLDTDIVLWQSCENWKFDGAALAGRYIPQFKDKWTKCITRPRLHTSLLYINPVEVRERVAKYSAQFPDTQFADKPFNPLANLIRQTIIPHREGRILRNYFYDTCSMLYHAIGGQHFNDLHLDCYDHIHAGTVSDLVAPCYPEDQIQETHFAIFENPNLAKGLWHSQDQFYKKHAI